MVCLAYGWVLSIRLVRLHPTFSRHGIAQILSALALLIWLNEKVLFTTYWGLQLISSIGHGARYVPLSLIN